MISTDPPKGPKAPIYAMHWLASERLRKLVADRELTCGHVGVLWFLVDHMDAKGYAWVTPTYLAGVLRRDATQTSREIKRLTDRQLVVRVRDPRTGRTGFMVNPYVAHVGPMDSRFSAWGRFKTHVGDCLKPDTIGVEVDEERERLQAVAA